jgi:DNA-binding NarL/FixJ family response regulator
MGEAIRVAMCDDARAVKMFLRHMLEEDGDLEVVSETSTGREALEHVAEHGPDVLLLDLLLPDVPEPADLVGQLRERAPHTAIVLISNLPEHRLRSEAERLGTDGWVPKAQKPEILRDIVRRAADRSQ